MEFIHDTAQDRNMRGVIVSTLPGILVNDWPGRTITHFEVTRTNDRKGYRDPRPYHNKSPYQSEPKTRITIELEVEDDFTPELQDLVQRVKVLETEAARQEARERLNQARLVLEQAHQAVHNASANLRALTGEEGLQ